MIAETFVAKHKFHFIHEREKTLFVIAASFPRTQQYKNEMKRGYAENAKQIQKRITNGLLNLIVWQFEHGDIR